MKEKVESMIRDAKMELRTFDTSSMEIRLKAIIQPMKSRIENSKRIITEEMLKKVEESRRIVTTSVKTLEVANPENVLKRGFAIVTASGNRIVRRPEDVADGEHIGIKLSEGELVAKVTFP